MKLFAIFAAMLPGMFLMPMAAPGQPCSAIWSDAFTFGLPSDPVRTMAVLDDGSGPALYVGGFFSEMGGVQAGGLMKWDGYSWQSLGGGTDGFVFSLAAYDDGSGPAVYAGGTFANAGNTPARNFAHWREGAWESLGENYAQIRALAVCDTGSGPELYAAGAGQTVFGQHGYIARWNGASWSPVGGGVDGTVRALAVTGVDNKQVLIVGGDFTHAGNKPAGHIARWDGKNWTTLGSGANDDVLSLAYADLGQGKRLYSGGRFTGIGGVSAAFVASWDGQSWSSLGQGLWAEELDLASVNAFTTFDDGTGVALYVGGDFDRAGDIDTSDIARWDGQQWTEVGDGIVGFGTRWVGALAAFQTLGGPRLFVGGQFERSHEHFNLWYFPHLATWSGDGWRGPPNRGVNLSSWDEADSGSAEAFATFDDGSGPAVYVAGHFARAGDKPAGNIARFDGRDWGTPTLPIDDAPVHALAVFDPGGGPGLYAGGYFGSAGGVPVNGIAGWNGKKWFPLGEGILYADKYPGEVRELHVFDAGGAPLLIAAGNFSKAGGVKAFNVAAWDGDHWSALGEGFGEVGPDGSVNALAVFDEGNGPSLFAGGYFVQSGQTELNRIARWDGQTWIDVGGGFDAPVRSLTVFDDGSGPALLAAGEFTVAGDVEAAHVARWDGEAWFMVGEGLPEFGRSLAVFDDGTGHILYAAWGGDSVYDPQGLSTWDGEHWTKTSSDTVFRLATATDRFGAALYCGTTGAVNGTSSRGIARLGCTEPVCPADCDASGHLDLFDFLCFTNRFNAGSPAADCTDDGVLDLFDFLCFVNLFNAGC